MQTYLLCFVVSDFSYVMINGNVPQRVFAPNNRIEAGDGDFGVRTGVNSLRAIDNYFGMDYSQYNTKMDQFSIPNLWYSAMVNSIF